VRAGEPDVERFDLKSVDPTDERREELRIALAEILPEVLTEGGKVDFAKLELALGEDIDVGKERYGLTWPGKAECFKTIQAPSLGTLRPCPEESINWDTTENLIIEGDNLEVLKLLQKSYLGKVTMIYIDPPYNTGNDFIYPDNYSESLQTYLEYTGQIDAEGKKFSTNTDTDGRFHSKWLNMMYPRLYLARNLLREDGVIFISIDESEGSALRLLLDEVFGAENFVGAVVWKHTVQSKNDERYFARHYNTIFVHRRSPTAGPFRLERTEVHNANYSNRDDDPRGAWRAGDVRSPNPRPTLRYKIKTPSGSELEPPANGWRWSKETLDEKLVAGEIIFSPDESRIIRKIYLADQEGRIPENVWMPDEVGGTRDGNSEIKDLFGEAVFDTAKPSTLIRRMIDLAVSRDERDLVVDFFAGSGSAAHAVLQANADDGGNRQFILVQLQERLDDGQAHGHAAVSQGFATISDITKERVRRVIRKLNEDDDRTLPVDGRAAPDRGFRVFKLDESNFTTWDAQASEDAVTLAQQLELHVDHVRDGRGEQDLLFELLLKSGFPLATPIEVLLLAGNPVYSVLDGALVVSLAREVTQELIDEIADLDPKPERVVCLDEGFAGNDQLKVNANETFRTNGIMNFKTV
jgi:adenine-specific DNA-methyltransferase